jgi:flavin reductase (DIM6/NTAB) family NADH-FMN oxidoreductase RutF
VSDPQPYGQALRDVMRTFPQGVVVVTADAGAGPRGVTVSSFISVSLAPPLVLVSIDRSSQAHGTLEAAGAFVINVLAETQGSLSEHFARSGLSSEDQFAEVGFAPGPLGQPRIDGCIAYLDCRIVEAVVQADHTLFIGEVSHGGVFSDSPRPLVFLGREYRSVGGPVHDRS